MSLSSFAIQKIEIIAYESLYALWLYVLIAKLRSNQ